MVPEVRVGDISLPEIRQCDVDDDEACTAPSDAGPGLSDDDAASLGTSPLQPKWFVMASDVDGIVQSDSETGPDASPQQRTDAHLLGFEMRGNLPREGALQLSVASPRESAQQGLGASLLAVPWQVPRRRHSWICRYALGLSRLLVPAHSSYSYSSNAVRDTHRASLSAQKDQVCD